MPVSIWTCYKYTVMKNAMGAYNNVYKKMFNIRKMRKHISSIYVANHIDSFKVLVCKNLGNFRSCLVSCDNYLVQCTQAIRTVHKKV